jgi:hypothetical protein
MEVLWKLLEDDAEALSIAGETHGCIGQEDSPVIANTCKVMPWRGQRGLGMCSI